MRLRRIILMWMVVGLTALAGCANRDIREDSIKKMNEEYFQRKIQYAGVEEFEFANAREILLTRSSETYCDYIERCRSKNE